MSTWVRNGTGTYPSSTDADVLGTMELDNGTVPGDFDVAGVNSVRIQYSVEIVSGTFTSPEHHLVLQDVNLQLDGVGTLIASVSGSDVTLDNGSGNIAVDLTDSSIGTGFSVAEWEGAELNPTDVASVLAWTSFEQNMGPDGVTVGLVSGSVTVTIDYEPSTSSKDFVTLAATTTIAATLANEFTEFVPGSNPTLRETSSGSDGATSTSYSVTLDGGAAIADDLAIIHIIGSQSSGDITTPLPTGWTQLYGTAHSDYSYGVWWKILTAGDLSASTADFVFNGTGGYHAHQLDIITKDTFDAADPIDVTDVDAPSATDNATVAATTTNADALLLIYAGVDISTTGTWTIDTGTETFDATLGPDDLSIAGYQEDATTAQLYTRTVTSSASSQDLHGIMVAVNATSGTLFTETLAATTTVTASMSTFKKFYRTFAAATTVAASMVHVAKRFITFSATTTLTAGMSLFKKFYRLLTATTTIAATLAQGGAELFFETLAAATTVAATLTRKVNRYITLPATTTVSAGIGKFTQVYVTFAATTTLAAGLAKASSLFRTFTATTTLTAVLVRKAIHYRVLAATTTIATDLTRTVSYYLTLAATTTVSASIALYKKFFILFEVASETTAVLNVAAGVLTEKALAVTSNIVASMALKLIMHRTMAANTTITPVMALRKKFYLLMEVPIVKWIVGRLPGGGAERGPAAILHQDALFIWLHENESAFFDSGEVVGALNDLNSTVGIEYDEARRTFLDG